MLFQSAVSPGVQSTYLHSRRYIYCFIISLFLSLLGSIASLQASNWTVLVYMAADNDLSSYAIQNINQMESVAQPPGTNLIVQVDLPSAGAKRYRIQPDSSPNITSPIVGNLGIIDSGAPQSLKDFVNWGFSSYPAQHKMLIIWSHADGWFKSSKWIAPDYDTGSVIGVANGELFSALSGTPHLDILLFDGCSMQQIETIYEIRTLTDYVIGSSDLVSVKGFPYARIIPVLNQSPQQLAAQIPDLYNDSYLPGGSNNPSSGHINTTCSAIRTDLLNDFFQGWRSFCTTLRSRAAELMDIRQGLFEMDSGGFSQIDLRQFLTRLVSHPVPFPQAETLLSLWNQIVVASAFTNIDLETGIGTAGIWFPKIPYNYENENFATWQSYAPLIFARTGWLGVVNQAFGEDNVSPFTPDLLTQSILFNTLTLVITAPVDPDSLYIRLESSAGTSYHYFERYHSTLSIQVQISSSGSYSLYAIDQSGNESQPLSGTYQYSKPLSRMRVVPNPVTDPATARLIWYHEDIEGKPIAARIYNLRGQLLARRYLGTVIVGDCDKSYLLNLIPELGDLSKGVYLIKLNIGKDILTTKFTILY